MYQEITEAKDQRQQNPYSFNVEFTRPEIIPNPMNEFISYLSNLRDKVGKEQATQKLDCITTTWAMENGYTVEYNPNKNLYHFIHKTLDRASINRH